VEIRLSALIRIGISIGVIYQAERNKLKYRIGILSSHFYVVSVYNPSDGYVQLAPIRLFDRRLNKYT
jgi:hypothetical protein